MTRLYQVIEWTGRPRASRRARVTVYQARNQGDAIRQHWRKHEPGALLVTAERIYGAIENNAGCTAPGQGVGGVGAFEREASQQTTPAASPAAAIAAPTMNAKNAPRVPPSRTYTAPAIMPTPAPATTPAHTQTRSRSLLT